MRNKPDVNHDLFSADRHWLLHRAANRARTLANENAGTIVAVIAAAAAVASVWVAEHARRDAIDATQKLLDKQQLSINIQEKARQDAFAAAQKSLEKQQESPDQQRQSAIADQTARNDAFRQAQKSLHKQQQSLDIQHQSVGLDERPFIVVRNPTWEVIPSTDSDHSPISFVRVKVDLATVGRTPAVNVRANVICKIVKYDDLRDPILPNILHFPLPSSEREAEPEYALLYDESYTLNRDCLGPDQYARLKLVPGLIEDREAVFSGTVIYQDLIDPQTTHHTAFCFTSGSLAVEEKGTGPLANCAPVQPKFD